MASYLYYVLFFFLTFPFLSHSHNQSLKKQASILLSLKQSFYYSQDSPHLNTWNLSNYSTLCAWEGIQCDNTSSFIITLDISSRNISGTISPTIANLKTITYISVANNNLSGELPISITTLSNLVYLNISNNNFNGTLSRNFSSMKNLHVFDAYNNNFYGSLPLGVTNLPMLHHLDFGGNYFSGSIPSSYGEFKEINYLSLSGNNLKGYIPRELGNLTTLKQLYLGYFNEFEGGIPTELGKLFNLVHLDLSNCGLQGVIPSQLGNFKNMDTLYLQANQLIGSIPPQLGNMSNLKVLDLSNNAITGGIPTEFSNLNKLNLLSLFINRLHGEIPEFIAELPNLEVLKLWHNNFTGSIPSKLGKNGRIRELDLSTNKLTGLIPRDLCFGKRLEILILLNNFLFGPLPSDLGECSTVIRVRMGQNYLTGSIPRGFLYLPNLELLELQNNYLTGVITEETRKKPEKLSQLNLSNNRLYGMIPNSIGNFTALQSLLLNGNQFTGNIPSQLGLLKQVQKIDLSMNNFSGIIPPQIGDCFLLTYLDLSKNQLSGPIPSKLSKIHVLNYFNVSWNNLNRSIPKEIGNIRSLTSADFSHNNFSGRIPETGQFPYFNASSFQFNPQLCGFVSYPCNIASMSPLQLDNNAKTQLLGKFKLLLAVGLLLCSIIFASTVVIKTRSVLRKNSKSWKLTMFQKLEFGSAEIIECLKDNCIIGKGGAGVVYRGSMPNGHQVAIKKLLGITKGSSHDNGFSAEIKTLGKIRHRNIVRLLAVCSNNEVKLLIYEFMPNGSLGEMLHGKRGGYLNWAIRMRIALEAARGLCYLHHDCSPPILHRDVKSNNILLDDEFEAHVADFGLAKFLRDTGASECMSAVAGSYGYIAPEYAYTLKVDEKSDVYSFGVVLLELITGKRPVGDFEEEGLDIVQWVKMNTSWSKEGVVKILDRRLVNVPLEEAMQLFFVGMLCVQEHSVERPTMREVVQMLEQAKQMPLFRA